MNNKTILSFATIALLSFSVNAQNIAVNTTGTAAASTNMFEVTQTSTAANMVAIYAIHSGAASGTGYGLYSTKTGASTTNIGGYFNASGGTNNYAIIVPSGGGSVGIGTTTPVSTLEVSGSLGLKTNAITSATTLNQTHNIVLASAASSNYTITLPAAASNTGKTYYIKKTDNTVYTITIDGNASETIDGATTLVLYVQYDAVRIVCDGSNWHVISDEIRPHSCRLVRTTAQTISNNTYTHIDFNSEDYDIGNIGDPVTNYRIDIRRSGVYQVTAFMTTNADLDADEWLTGYMTVNGITVSRDNDLSRGTNWYLASNPCQILYLSAGDHVEFNITHSEGASINTDTNSYSRPTLAVAEIR
jgi:hypothetical protein